MADEKVREDPYYVDREYLKKKITNDNCFELACGCIIFGNLALLEYCLECVFQKLEEKKLQQIVKAMWLS